MKGRWLPLAVPLLFLSLLSAESILMLPPPSPPRDPQAQKALFLALKEALKKTGSPWKLVTFQKESPTLLRALREGRISREALERPDKYAAPLCQLEGTRAAFWFRITEVGKGGVEALQACLLFPEEAEFEGDILFRLPTKEERESVRQLKVKAPLDTKVLAWRLAQWLTDRLKNLPPPSRRSGSKPHLSLARELMEKGEREEALKVLSALIADDPQNPDLYLALGQLYERWGRWEDAHLEYRRAIRLKGDLWAAWKGIARVAERRGRWEQVLEAIQKLWGAGAADPSDLALGARIALLQSRKALRQGRDEEAQKLRRKARLLDEELLRRTDDPSLLRDAVDRLMQLKEWKRAWVAAEKALKKAPYDETLREKAIELAMRLNRPKDAYRHLLTLAKIHPPLKPSPASFHLFAQVMDLEAVRLFRRVRDAINDFYAKKLTRDDFWGQIKRLNTDAETLLRLAHTFKPPPAFSQTHPRRLLSYELFAQATTMLMRWITKQEDLIYQRAIVLYDFARMELEKVNRQENRT